MALHQSLTVLLLVLAMSALAGGAFVVVHRRPSVEGPLTAALLTAALGVALFAALVTTTVPAR